jgi:hypothetical protein
VHDLQSLSCPVGQIPVVGAACNAASGIAGGAAGAAAGAAGSILGDGVTAVFKEATQLVAQGAAWLLDEIGHLMSQTTSVGLGTSWFSASESQMALLAASVVLPMACIGAIQAIYRHSPGLLVRSFLVNLPLSVLLTGVAVELVRVGLSVTDTMSNQVLAAGGVNTSHLLQPVSSFLLAGGLAGGAAAGAAGAGAVATAGVPLFVVFIAGLLVTVCALVLWLELIVRAAALAAAALFLPFALASLVWPAISHWCRRLAETIAALVLSKFVIASVISLAAGAIAGGLGTEGSNGGGIGAVATGIALLLMATLAPFTLLKLVPAVEAGAIAHLESVRHRFGSAARQGMAAGDLALSIATGAPSGADALLAVRQKSTASTGSERNLQNAIGSGRPSSERTDSPQTSEDPGPGLSQVDGLTDLRPKAEMAFSATRSYDSASSINEGPENHAENAASWQPDALEYDDESSRASNRSDMPR